MCVEQELFTRPEHLSSPPVFSGVHVTRSLVLYVCFVDRCLSFCAFSFGHCVVCSFSIYRFWLPLWYLLVIVLSVLRYTDSDYLFGIFWPLCCLSIFDIRILIAPLVSSNISCIFYYYYYYFFPIHQVVVSPRNNGQYRYNTYLINRQYRYNTYLILIWFIKL